MLSTLYGSPCLIFMLRDLPGSIRIYVRGIGVRPISPISIIVPILSNETPKFTEVTSSYVYVSISSFGKRLLSPYRLIGINGIRSTVKEVNKEKIIPYGHSPLSYPLGMPCIRIRSIIEVMLVLAIRILLLPIEP